jgi:hypothetical protein
MLVLWRRSAGCHNDPGRVVRPCGKMRTTALLTVGESVHDLVGTLSVRRALDRNGGKLAASAKGWADRANHGPLG